MKIGTCVPLQNFDRVTKLQWLDSAMKKTKCDFFVAPQEYFGGHWIMPKDLHIGASWLHKEMSALAKKHKMALAVGAATLHQSGGATQDYHYYAPSGAYCGHHRKFAHPGYDDVRAKGAGALWPEVSYSTRTTPVEIPDLGLRIGTVFCWEVFSLSIFPAYSFAGCNLIVHPIKFCPRGWPKLEAKENGRHIKAFGVINKGRDLWKEKLIMAGAHEAMCPIVVTCNSWNLGKNFFALTGHVDEIVGNTTLIEVECVEGAERIYTFDMNPALYTGLDRHFSMAEFKQHVGSLDNFHKLDPWTMHVKVRRLEAQLIGGTTRLDCALKAATQIRQKKSSFKRAEKRLNVPD